MGSPTTQTDPDQLVLQQYAKALALEYPPPLAAVLALSEAMALQSASTTSHLLLALQHNSKVLYSSHLVTYGAQAGIRLFERWVRDSVGNAGRRTTLDEIREGIVEEGRKFAANGAAECREKIATNVQGFLRDDCTILTHSFSRVVLMALKKAHDQNKRVNVYVTEGRPGCGGLKTHAALTSLGIPCSIVLDSAVGYIMDRVDLVIVGSEAVVESGGLVAGVGTYQMAVLAKALGKPFYALAESYKFLRLFPLSQADLPPLPSATPSSSTDSPASASSSKPILPLSSFTILPSPLASPRPKPTRLDSDVGSESGQQRPGSSGGQQQQQPTGMTAEMLALNPRYDYTPRDAIGLVISDVGILTPDSVSSYLVIAE